ncbi:MAG: ionic transporter y4hA [Bdellovibrionaceae bacterium]|nr:ionic transporter y4hA [Pseudobdellovibrionaceae bacterium]MBX3032981.1 ionic transporter y4hA [Pseudobdellovibrionaceae bacterium]
MANSSGSKKEKLFDSSHAVSILCGIVLAVVLSLGHISPWIAPIAILFLATAVMMAVHHAEVIALRVGPSLGALILALSVTVIEVGLIVSLMSNDTPDSLMVARDTVFSAVIIVTNGIMGVCLLIGGLKFKELGFHVGGASSLLSALVVLSGLTLVLPNFTTSTVPGTYSTAQLIFVSIACVFLYFSLVFSQTVTHKDYFEPLSTQKEEELEEAEYIPSRQRAWISFAGLLLTLCVVIGLAKALSPSIEAGVNAMGAPRTLVGIVIALLVLAPETWAAVSAARTNQLQTSLNLALGSGAASIALTVPVVSVFSIMTDRQLVLGLDGKGLVFLIMTFITGGLTLGGGRGTALMGIMHLAILLAFLALNFIP